MIKEWQNHAAASALESAGRESAACCFAPRGEKGSGSVWQRKWNQTNAESLHMSVQMLLILLASMGWRWGVHGVWMSCFAGNEGVWKKMLCLYMSGLFEIVHTVWDTVHQLLSIIPCLGFVYMLSPSHFFSLCAGSYHSSVLGSHFANTEPQGTFFSGAMGVLHKHINTHSHTCTHTFTRRGLIDFSLPAKV